MPASTAQTQTAQQTVKDALADGQDVSAETAKLIYDNLPAHLKPMFTCGLNRVSSVQGRRVIAMTYADYMKE